MARAVYSHGLYSVAAVGDGSTFTNELDAVLVVRQIAVFFPVYGGEANLRIFNGAGAGVYYGAGAPLSDVCDNQVGRWVIENGETWTFRVRYNSPSVALYGYVLTNP